MSNQERMIEHDQSKLRPLRRRPVPSMHAKPYLEPGATGGFLFWRRLSLVLLSAVFGACFCAVYFLTTVGHVNPHDRQPNRRSTMTNERTLPPWKPGMLDIHHLHVGPSEVSR